MVEKRLRRPKRKAWERVPQDRVVWFAFSPQGGWHCTISQQVVPFLQSRSQRTHVTQMDAWRDASAGYAAKEVMERRA